MSEDLITNDDPAAAACTAVPGTEHDYRPYDYLRNNLPRTSLRCVWCHVVACGNYSDPDPCLEPYHHRTPHKSRFGVTWPIGGTRPR